MKQTFGFEVTIFLLFSPSFPLKFEISFTSSNFDMETSINSPLSWLNYSNPFTPEHHQPTALHAIGHELSPRLPVLYHASNLLWRWWVYLADYAGNVLMKHQLWATGLTFAMFRVEKGVPLLSKKNSPIMSPYFS